MFCDSHVHCHICMANMSNSHLVMDEDFSAADPLEIVFGVNETMACAMISIIDDTALEGDHSFSVTLASTVPPITINNIPVEVTIMDNEGTYLYKQCCYI